jgi:predicted permease
MRVVLARILGFLRSLVGGRRPDRDLDDEVGFHVDMLVDDYVRRGLTRDRARAMALRSFGGITQVKEGYRDQRGLPWLEMLAQDVRYGMRTLRRAPGFTLAALITLALGIGANSAIFSVVNAVLLRPLPYPEPDRLVHLLWRHPSNIGSSQTGLRFIFFRDRLASVDALAAFCGLGSFNLLLTDRSEFVSALGVSKEYFTVFGARPAIGQPFTADQDRPGGPDVAILLDDLWRRQFAGDPDIIGKSILLGDRPYAIVGVMPASFRAPAGVDLLLPLQTAMAGRGGGFNYTVAGRLRAGMSVERASADVGAVWHALKDEHPKAMLSNEMPSSFVALQESLASSVRPALLMMFVAVGLLLLIACANTANLLFARALGRGREMAVRAALGAGRSRIARQLLTESVLLALAGGVAGTLLAYWLVPTLLSLTPPGFVVDEDVRIDSTVLLVTLATAVLTGLLFGIAPALSVTRRGLVDAFKDASGRTTAGRRSGGLRAGLVVGQIAVCMLLLVGAGLLTRTFLSLRAVDPGFDPRGVLAAGMSMQGNRYADPEDLNRFYNEGLDRIRRIRGVQSAAVASGLPLARALNLNVDVLDWPETGKRVEDEVTDWRYVTAGYFETMRISIVAGRAFTDGDVRGALPVAIVSEEFARRLFKGTSALGRHIRVFDADGAMQIVGIAKDLKEGGLKGRSRLVMYVPVSQTNAQAVKIAHGYFQTNWVVRAENAGPDLTRQIAEAIRQVDPRQPFAAFRTLDQVKNAAMATERFQMTLLSAFAATGLLLAAAGIYGLIAYSVAQRTREFGIRLALGATRQRIVGSVVRQGAVMAAAGVTLGAAGAVALSKVLRNYVWGVSPLDARTYITVGAILLLVAAAASVVPALRAVRLNPLRALRE